MKAKALLIVINVMVVIFLFMLPSAAQTVYVYGYVSYDHVPVNGAVVSLSNEASGQNVTQNKDGQPGYYEFFVDNGSKIVVTASYGNHSSFKSYFVNVDEVRIDLDISAATPTPTPTPIPSPTPRPSQEPGGMVIRNESSSFMPMAPQNTVTPVPWPSISPTPAPTIAPTPTPTPTPTPAPGLLSNIYIWLGIALIAILAIAAAILIYLRK
jgi:hypothetical protein